MPCVQGQPTRCRPPKVCLQPSNDLQYYCRCEYRDRLNLLTQTPKVSYISDQRGTHLCPLPKIPHLVYHVVYTDRLAGNFGAESKSSLMQPVAHGICMVGGG